MNNLPAVIPETPEWFLGEVEDLLELLKKSDKKKGNYIVSIPEFQYIQTLPQRLFRCRFIDAQEMKSFQKKLYQHASKSKNSSQFLLLVLFYIFQSGLLKHELKAFKDVRDVLIAVVQKVANTQKYVEKTVAEIIKVDNKFFPEVREGEVVGPDGAIIDSIYSGLEQASDIIIPLLYQEDYVIERELITIYTFYAELLSLKYINEEIYSYLIQAKPRDIKIALCVGILHAFSAGFYDNDYSLKESLAYLIREYFTEKQESKLLSWAEEIFTRHDIILGNYSTSP